MTGWLDALGRTLVHFVWQGALVAAALGVVLAVVRRRGPQARYLACCAALGAFVAIPAATFLHLMGVPSPPIAGDPALAATFPTPDPLVPLLPWIATFWLGGVSVLQFRIAYAWLCMRRLRRTGIAPLPDGWVAVAEDLGRRLGLRRAVPVVRSSVASVPMVVGWLSPMVLVPVQVFTGLDREQLRAVLAHELAHVRRHDAWVNLLQLALETLFFYHPAVWWVSQRLRAEREYCCDDLAVGICGDPVVYARALDRIDTLRDPSPALAATGGPLLKRIERLVRTDHRHDKPSATGLLATFAVAAVIVVTGFAIAGDEPPEPAPAPAPVPPVMAPPPAPERPAPVARPATAPPAPAPPPRVGATPALAGARIPPPRAAPVVEPATGIVRPRPDGAPVVRIPASAPPAPGAEPAPPGGADPAPAPEARPAPPLPPLPPTEPTPALAAAPTAEPTPALAGVPTAEPPAEAPKEPAPVDPPEPPAEPTIAESIQQELSDIRRLRGELEERERRLLRLLEQYERVTPPRRAP